MWMSVSSTGKVYTKNLLVSWFDDKELSLRTDIIG